MAAGIPWTAYDRSDALRIRHSDQEKRLSLTVIVVLAEPWLEQPQIRLVAKSIKTRGASPNTGMSILRILVHLSVRRGKNPNSNHMVDYVSYFKLAQHVASLVIEGYYHRRGREDERNIDLAFNVSSKPSGRWMEYVFKVAETIALPRERIARDLGYRYVS